MILQVAGARAQGRGMRAVVGALQSRILKLLGFKLKQYG